MAEDPINPLLGFFNALEQRKGAKGVVNDGKKVSATLTPEETARYTNIFKIMKDVVNPGPEAGTIAATPDSGTTPESTATDSASPGTTKKEDGFSLSSLMGLLPALGPALALLGPALAGAIVAGIVAAAKDIDWDDVLGDLENWLSDKLFPQPSDEEIKEDVAQQRGKNTEIVNAINKSNTSLQKLQTIAENEATEKDKARLKELREGPQSRESKMEEWTIIRRLVEGTKGGKEAIDQATADKLRAVQLEIDFKSKRNLEGVNANNLSPGTPDYFGSSAITSSNLNRAIFEDERRADLVDQERINRAKARRAELLDQLLASKLGFDTYMSYTDRDHFTNAHLTDRQFAEKLRKFRQEQAIPFYREMEAKFENKATEADDLMVNSNGDVYNLDSQDSLVAAKPGGPIDKMLDQNSAIQRQQLNVLVAIREEVNAIRSSMSSNVSVAGTALTQEFYAQ